MPFTLYKHQIEPCQKILEILRQKSGGVVLSAPAGSGKTFPTAQALRLAQEQGILDPNSSKIASILYLCPKSAVIQQHRVLAKEGVKHFMVSNYAMLRSFKGGLLIDWIKDKNGDDFPIWNQEEFPDVIIADECQMLKSPTSQQTLIVTSYIKQRGLVIFISFTPFQKVVEAKTIALGCQLIPNEGAWLNYAYSISGRAAITDNSPTATKRIKEDLEYNNRWITFDHIYWKYKAKINTLLIDFDNQAEREAYEKAYEEYLEVLAKANKFEPEGIRALWVAMMKYWTKAEWIKAPKVAAQGFYYSTKENKQVIIATNFIESLRRTWENLVKVNKVPREQIGFLVGGQSDKERQKFIDLFQEGKLDYLLLTLKTGGTSLSLHHELESARPRNVILPLTWSVFDMAQVLGRAHRINSLSVTNQEILGYAGTIEGDRILPRLTEKLKCIRELINKKDSFIIDILNQESNNELSERMLLENKENEDDEDTIDAEMIETN